MVDIYFYLQERITEYAKHEKATGRTVTIDNRGNINCYNCENCEYCENCKDCKSCKGCEDCEDCTYCLESHYNRSSE